ncbi:MAG: uroporphyrinogen-III synthase [Chlamydiales bacterium]
MSKSKKVLYLGLDPSRWITQGEITHIPLIHTAPYPFSHREIQMAFAQIPSYTHFLFTSRTTPPIFVDYAARAGFGLDLLEKKTSICLGKATEEALSKTGLFSHYIAETPSAEGVVALLERLSLEEAYLFFPHSALARRVIPHYLQEKAVKHKALPLYTTRPSRVLLPDLASFDEIIFTSPSTVLAFRSLCTHLPPFEKCRWIGLLTQQTLKQIWHQQ